MYTYAEIKRTSLLDLSDYKLLGEGKAKTLSNLGVPLVWLWGSKSILNLPVRLPSTGGDSHSLASHGNRLFPSEIKQG